MKKEADRDDEALRLALYRAMWTARRLDEMDRDLARRGEASFHLSGAGHEAMAALAPWLTPADWLHAHYRDRALLLARGFPAAGYLHNVLARAGSDSAARRMPPFVSHPALHILSMPTLVGNNALQATGVAAAVREQPGRPIVYCGLGDGGTQEGEVLEALAESVRERLPVLFVVQNNRYALSTATRGRTFFDRPDGPAREFYGLPLRRVDGRDALGAWRAMGPIVAELRATRGPAVVIFDIERLADHSNSDDQRVYRAAGELAEITAAADPVVRLAAALDAAGQADERAALEKTVAAELDAALAAALAAPAPAAAISAKIALPERFHAAHAEYRGDAAHPELTLRDALRETLRAQLAGDPRVWISGQDVEDPKGDVFGVTRGLSTAFPGRVVNAPLSEATIAGAAVGRALAGQRPIVFLQFADFFPPAFNQIYAELAAMHWRTNGQWSAPVVFLAVTGGYRPGLGPYHAQTPDAFFAHTPGLDVFCPSTAADAAGLLNAAVAAGRPAILFYPKNLLNDPSLKTSADTAKHFVPLGRLRQVRAGQDLTLVAWGNTVALCERAADALQEAGVTADVLDLRSLSPWDRAGVVASAARTGRLIVAHEDMGTAGFGAEVMAAVTEDAPRPVAMRRVTGPDTLLPFNYENQLALLPSVDRLLEAAAGLLGLELTWEEGARLEAGRVIVNAIGSSPSDETVMIVKLHVRAGADVRAGDVLASVESNKAAMDLAAPVAGRVETVHLKETDQVRVGTPLLELRATADAAALPAARLPRRARLARKVAPSAPTAASAAVAPLSAAPRAVRISSIHSAVGAREVTNEELTARYPGWTPRDVVQRTGIEKRYWIGPGENALTLAVQACRKLFAAEQLAIADFDAIICSTGTPLSTTPSLACRVLKELCPTPGAVQMQAHDVNAACTGYLYALQQAYDLLQHDPTRRILVITAETLSPMINFADPGTLFLFGDAATASLVSCEERPGNIRARVSRPVLSALGEEEKVLYVPALNSGDHIEMDGKHVFRVAVRKMIDMLEKACAAGGVTVNDLDMIVPHQANERIIEAIQKAIKFPTDKVFYYIRDYGNTSSNTIPLALAALLRERHPDRARIGLCAFGGGFTFGAGLLDVS